MARENRSVKGEIGYADSAALFLPTEAQNIFAQRRDRNANHAGARASKKPAASASPIEPVSTPPTNDRLQQMQIGRRSMRDACQNVIASRKTPLGGTSSLSRRYVTRCRPCRADTSWRNALRSFRRVWRLLIAPHSSSIGSAHTHFFWARLRTVTLGHGGLLRLGYRVLA